MNRLTTIVPFMYACMMLSFIKTFGNIFKI